jgi:MoxR-like ATPase
MPPVDTLPRISKGALKQARTAVLDVHLSDLVKDYIVRLVDATRNRDNASTAEYVRHPVSPRGTLALARLSQARAWLLGRDHVLPDDVQALAVDVLSHRIGLTYRAEAEGVDERHVITGLLERVVVV